MWPREFHHGNLLLKQSGKIPVAYRGSYFVEKKKRRHLIRCDLVFLIVLLPSFIHHFGHFVLVDSPRFPKASGIDPEKALEL